MEGGVSGGRGVREWALAKGGALGSGSRPEILVSIVGGRGGGGGGDGGGGAFGRCQTGSVQEDACRVAARGAFLALRVR